MKKKSAFDTNVVKEVNPAIKEVLREIDENPFYYVEQVKPGVYKFSYFAKRGNGHAAKKKRKRR